MKRKYFYNHSIWLLTCILLVSACKEDEYALPTLKPGLQNDAIKRTLGPNVAGLDIEFAYAMAIPDNEGRLTSARVEASIPGAVGTWLENNSYHTDGSGDDIPTQMGEPTSTSGAVSEMTFTRDTVASTLRYYYIIPDEARGQSVSFKFSATASNGQSVSFDMGPYKIAKMEMVRLLTAVNNAAAYISIADMTIYDAAGAAANPDKIDLVYLYRAAPASFAHALVSPAAEAQYLPGVTLPAGVNKSTRVRKAWAIKDFHLAQTEVGVYIDDLDFERLDVSTSPNFAINMKAESGAWVETADGQYRAYIYVNSVNNGGQSMTISMKRYSMN
ncbi:MAG: DUF4466 family protein [Cyclobacteriaceae bacterium]